MNPAAFLAPRHPGISPALRAQHARGTKKSCETATPRARHFVVNLPIRGE